MIRCTHRKRSPEPRADMALGDWLRAAFGKATACGEPADYATHDGVKCEPCATRWVQAMLSEHTIGGMLLRREYERRGEPLPTEAELRARVLRPLL